MCDSIPINEVLDCPIRKANLAENCDCCRRLKFEDISRVVSEVQKWSDEHLIDWSKVPIDTPVLVKMGEISDKVLRYFGAYVPSTEKPFFCFNDGKKAEDAVQMIRWKYCELHPSVDPTPFLKE